MSCFIVNNKTASSIVTALVEMNHIHVSEAQTFLSLMMMINTLSVNARYSENQSAPEYIFEIQQNDFYEENGDVNYPAMMQMITNIAFFKYQSCEFEEFESTLVFITLQKLQDEILDEFKIWCVQSGFETWESVRDKPYYNLPFGDKCSWGLHD